MQSTLRNKKSNISVLRIMATLAVVFLHTSSGVLDRPDLYIMSTRQRDFLFLCKGYMNWAVPVFLMISGALLLKSEKQISFHECISKYVKRIILALFCFGIPFSLMELFLNTRTFSAKMLYEAVICVITGNSWGHLWYLYMLIGIYCLLPIFKHFIDTSSRREVGCILVTLFVFQFIIPFIQTITGLTIAFNIPITPNTVFYLLLGKYLSDGLPRILIKKRLTVLFLTISFALAAYTYLLTHDERFWVYFTPIFAILIFALFQDVNVPEHVYPIIWKIDRLCFGVYLIHTLFINFSYKALKITPISFNAYPLMVVVFFLVFAGCSFFASAIMSMIPFLKKYIL